MLSLPRQPLPVGVQPFAERNAKADYGSDRSEERRTMADDIAATSQESPAATAA